jgi:adenylate cyclase
MNDLTASNTAPGIAAAYAHMGDLSRAREHSMEATQQKPDFSTRVFASKHPFKLRAELEHFVAGLRKAGLPE